GEPVAAEIAAASQTVGGQQDEREAGERGHGQHALQRGSALTSLSHLSRRRRRSADEPYFLKSYSISLISESRGASFGISAPRLDGTWNCLLRAPSDWAGAVSAQSANLRAPSRLRAPLTMLSEPISYPVPSHGVTLAIGNPATVSVTTSCTKLIPTNVSPRATAF